MLPNRYPSDARGIRLDLSAVRLNEKDEGFWNLTTTLIQRSLSWYLEAGLGSGGEVINHLSIFALAQIPLLIYFGKQLGDMFSADVYQRHRSTNDWRWQEDYDESFKYVVSRPSMNTWSATEVAVNLSLSGRVCAGEIEQVLGQKIPIYTVAAPRPHRDFLHSRKQLDLFRDEWYKLLAEIREVYGQVCTVHLFPAIPISVAVEIGRSLLPHVDPLLTIYNKKRSGFYRTIEV